MAYTTIPKFVFFICDAGSLSLGQNLSVISACSLQYSQGPITRLISTHTNAVRIITTFSIKAHLMIICSHLRLNFTDGFYTIHLLTTTIRAHSVSFSYFKCHAHFRMTNLVHLNVNISFPMLYIIIWRWYKIVSTNAFIIITSHTHTHTHTHRRAFLSVQDDDILQTS
jgi:hypothetical protein